MKFVVDTNILFSAVLNTQGKIGDLLMNSHGIFDFCACDTLRNELRKHRQKLLDLSQLSEDQLEQSVYQITSCLNFTNEALIPFEIWMKAVSLVREIDMNDVAFVALAEFLNARLWTGDRELMKGLAKIGYTNFITTDELHTLRGLLE
ncbi:MAG: PIN domain-containing protein [Saprospiraceae bacterium]